MRELLGKLSRSTAAVTEVVAVLMAAAMLTSLFSQVVSRYFFSSALIWTEELAVLLFVWIIFLMGSLGVQRGFHVKFALISDALSNRLGILQEVISDLTVLSISLILIWQGSRYVFLTAGQVSAAVQYPVELLHMAVPVSGLLIALHVIAKLLNIRKATLS